MTACDARFAEIYRTFSRRLHAYCMRRTTPDRVDDAVAEVFLVAWRRIDDVPAGDEALPWLYAVAYRVLGNQWRGESRRRKLADKLAEVGVNPVSSTEDLIVAGEQTQQVLRAISLLKRTDQEILKLATWEELSHSDIATVLGISQGAVKQRLYAARKNLTREFNRLEKNRINTPAAVKGGGPWRQKTGS